jgi:outer membrane protein assembly factor BamB
MLSRCRLLVLSVAALGLVAGEPPEQLRKVVLPGETRQVLSRLKLADALAAQKKWPEAVDEYQRLLNSAGDALVPADAGKEELSASRRSVQLRRLCHARLAALPPEGLEVYRGRVDLQARRWLQQGIAQQDAEALRRVVDEAFCSRAGDQTLDLLGDLAFARGDFARARSWWRLLARPASEADPDRKPRRGELLFPDPKIDVARVRAKQVLACLFEDDRAAAEAELQAFRALHQKASGHLAGRDGNYVTTLQEWLRRPPLSAQYGQWPTFAGRASRQRDLPELPPRRLWADGPTWRVRLGSGEKVAPDGPDRLAPSAALARRLAFHPVIVGDRVLVADVRQVTAFDLPTGALVFRYDLKTDGGHGAGGAARLPAEPDVRYTLTAADGRVYVCLGAPADRARKGDSFLVCLDLRDGDPGQKRERWAVQAKDPAGGPAFFEGAPVVDAGRVYVALSRSDAGRTRTAVVCFDAETGASRWRQEVCEVPEPPGQESPRPGRHLLTLTGPLLVYCSQAGAVVALDARAGKPAWGVRYPSRGPTPAEGAAAPRDQAPAVYADSRLFVAPRDSNRVFCLDPESGRTLWERDGIAVVELLGCSRGRLVFTTPQGCRALGARSGSDADGWVQPVEGKLPGFGRGLLAGGWVLWPVRDARLPLRALNVETGQQRRGEDVLEPTQLRQIRPGNLAFGEGCLVVAGVEELACYVPPERFLEKRRDEAARPGASAAAWCRLAHAEIGAGLRREAVEHLKRLEQAAGRGAEREAAREERHTLLLDLARQAETSLPGERRWEVTAGYLNRAAAADFPTPLRLRALQRLAEWRGEADQPRKEVEVWQAVLREESPRQGILQGPTGHEESAAAVAYTRIGAAIHAHGADVYGPIEKEARAALADRDLPRALAHWLPVYPNAAATRAALGKLAGQPLQPGQCADAAQACRYFLGLESQSDGQGPKEIPALRGLARAYEGQRCWEAARAAWVQLEQDHNDEAARKRLRSPEYAALARNDRGAGGPGELALPLRRTWQARSGRLLVPCRSPLAPRQAEVVFTARDRELTCRDAASGSLHWIARLPRPPTWLGSHADMVVAAWPEGIDCLRLADGRPLWAWPVEGDAVPEGRPLSGFRLTGRHLLFFQGTDRLVALSLDLGAVSWDRCAPSCELLPQDGGEFHTNNCHVGEEWVVLHTTGGHRLSLDSRNGIQMNIAVVGKEAWPQPPLALDEYHLAVVESARRVRLLTPGGKEIWTWKPRLPTTLTGEPPRLLGGRDALFLLVPRNYGYDLERLDPATGAPLWPAAARLLPEAVDGAAVAADENAVYVACRDTLTARALADGKLLWRRPLGETAPRWRVVRAGRWLAVWPLQMDWGPTWSWLPLGDLTLAVPRRARLGRPFPVLLHDARDGALVQRLNFETDVPAGAVQLFPGRLVVDAGNVTWGLQAPLLPDAR